MHAVTHKPSSPKGIEIDDWGPDLVITRRWLYPSVWQHCAFCAFWVGMFVAWHTVAVTQLRAGRDPKGCWAAIIVATPHLLIGIYWIYYVLCCLLNQTRFVVTADSLAIQHGPLPWPGNRQLPSEEIRQIFCVQNRDVRRNAYRPEYTYDLVAWKNDETYETLAAGIEDLGQAHFIERQIEDSLGLHKEHGPPGYRLLERTKDEG